MSERSDLRSRCGRSLISLRESKAIRQNNLRVFPFTCVCVCVLGVGGRGDLGTDEQGYDVSVALDDLRGSLFLI